MQLPFSAPAISARSTPAHYYCSISISFAGESISSLHFLPLPPHGMGWDGFCRHRFTSVLARASSVSSSWDPASACCLDMTHLDRRMHLLHPTPANLSISFPARYTSPTLHPDVPLPVSLLHSCPSQALLSSSSHLHPRDPSLSLPLRLRSVSLHHIPLTRPCLLTFKPRSSSLHFPLISYPTTIKISFSFSNHKLFSLMAPVVSFIPLQASLSDFHIPMPS